LIELILSILWVAAIATGTGSHAGLLADHTAATPARKHLIELTLAARLVHAGNLRTSNSRNRILRLIPVRKTAKIGRPSSHAGHPTASGHRTSHAGLLAAHTAGHPTASGHWVACA
jgi:hypothetical protein